MDRITTRVCVLCGHNKPANKFSGQHRKCNDCRGELRQERIDQQRRERVVTAQQQSNRKFNALAGWPAPQRSK